MQHSQLLNYHKYKFFNCLILHKNAEKKIDMHVS